MSPKNNTDIHIVGGGVSGLSVGIFLARLGYNVIIFERRSIDAFAGMGFLLTPNGVAVLKRIFEETWSQEVFYHPLSALILRDIDAQSEHSQEATEMYGILRPPLLKRLEELFIETGGQLRVGYDLVDVTFSQGNDPQIEALLFKVDNEILTVNTRFVLGADGIHSRMRSMIFSNSKLREPLLTEFVGLSYFDGGVLPKGFEDLSHDELIKYYSPQKRQAFGFMPLCGRQYIWYAQISYSEDLPFEDGETRCQFLKKLYSQWPSQVTSLLDRCSFERTYRWDTRDVVVMPTSYSHGVMLMGDAAHASLTISSQGVATALEDSEAFANILDTSLPDPSLLSPSDWHSVCERFDRSRLPTWLKRQADARALQDQFLNATLSGGVPFVKS